MSRLRSRGHGGEEGCEFRARVRNRIADQVREGSHPSGASSSAAFQGKSTPRGKSAVVGQFGMNQQYPEGLLNRVAEFKSTRSQFFSSIGVGWDRGTHLHASARSKGSTFSQKALAASTLSGLQTHLRNAVRSLELFTGWGNTYNKQNPARAAASIYRKRGRGNALPLCIAHKGNLVKMRRVRCYSGPSTARNHATMRHQQHGV
jgi:hypothetical protein